LTSGAKG